jgi:hypothetical protein
MNLYFPTSSLNFNDIFATESISPRYVYKERKFGTKSHFFTELNPNEMFMTLFTKMPYFSLIDENLTDYEQYPIIIEISIDDAKDQFIKLSDVVYATSQTVYFQRENIKIYFFSDEHLKMVLVKSKLANETKLVKKYENRFNIILRDTPSRIEVKNTEFPVLSENDIELTLKYDKIVNSFKGLYYTFIIYRYQNKYSELYNRYKQSLIKLNYIKKSLEYKDNEDNAVSRIIDKLLITAVESQEECVESLEKNYDMIIHRMDAFSVNDRNKFELISDLSNISAEERIFEIIINCIIENPKSRTGNIDDEEIYKLIESVGKAVAGEGIPYVFRNDMALIYKRIVNRALDINVENIRSIVMKNFFTFVLKYNNIDELKHFIKIKNITNDYLCYSYYGAFYGFSGLSRILTHDLFLTENNDLFDIIDFNISKVRKQLWKNIISIKDYKKQFSKAKVNNFQQETITDVINKKEVTTKLDSNLNGTNLLDIDKLIYSQIKVMKESKNINVYIKRKKVTLDLSEHDIIFNFEKLNSGDVLVTIDNTESSKKFNILLKPNKNCSEDEKLEFKRILETLEVDMRICKGNYNVVSYRNNNDSNSMSELDKNILLNNLQLLNEAK